MSFLVEERTSYVSCVQSIMYGRTVGSGTTIRPASAHWHLVFVRDRGQNQAIIAGPLRSTGQVTWSEGAEILWIKFKLGTYLPHLPALDLCDRETLLPEASSKAFHLKGSTWQIPTFENADVLVERLARADVLVRDPLVSAVLQGQAQALSPRTVRHHFQHTTGLSQTEIFQLERAQRAETLLARGVSILDVVDSTGYFDQPHLTRSLKRWIGRTPAEILRTQPS